MTTTTQRVIHHFYGSTRSSAIHFQREKPQVITEGFTSSSEVFQAMKEHVRGQLPFEISFDNLLSTPIPTTAYPNQKRGVYWNQTEFYRTPRYLLLTNKLQGYMLSRNLLNCACLRFYADDGYITYDKDDVFNSPFSKLKSLIEEHKTDIIIFPYNKNYKEVEKFIKETFPDIAFLVYCTEIDESKNREKYASIAKKIREGGYYAITRYEILDHQEYVSHITAHALGKRGIENLRKVIT